MVKVSVLMPIYRTKEEFLREAIESILHQTYNDFEFLILDDCPDNDRECIVKSYKDARIKYFKNNKNLGITPSRNRLIELAQGEYLAIMDHDDVSLPERFAKQVKYLDEHKDVGVVGSFIHKIVGKKDIHSPIEDDDIKSGLMMKCVIAHPSSMIRKNILVENNIKYKKHYSPAEDYKLWCDLIDVTNFYNIPEVLFKYRDWKQNTTSSQSTKMEKATFEIWAENKVKHPELWQKFSTVQASFVSTIRLFNFIPFIKIKQNGRRKQILLFDFIPLLKIKNSVKV
jgi:glycosyltransferase involved in cell wall biosynthesis